MYNNTVEMNRWNTRLALITRSLRHLCLVLTVVGAVLQAVISPAPVRAEGKLGVTGSFPNQVFEIPLGGSVSGPSIDMWVLNESTEQMGITVLTMAPPGVTVSVQPADSLTLPSLSKLQLFVSVEVSTLAQLGVYEDGLSVIAQASRTSAEGVQIVESVRLNASIAVVGDSGTVSAKTVSPTGDPVIAQIRLFKVIGGTNYEYAYSDDGIMEVLVSPGSFVAYAYKSGTSLAKTDVFEVAKDDHEDVVIEVRTLYFQGFGLQPEYLESGELSQARVVYTVVNLEREMANAEVRLSVNLGGTLLDTVPILNVDPLTLGRVGAPYLYAPAAGWEKGTYGFSLQLYADGELQTETIEQTLKVGGGGGVASSLWIIFVILGILGAAGLGFLVFFLLKRRQKGEKPEKAEKKERKKKEEKPAPKAAEPVRKPEPYRPPEPVRPVQPVRYEEPTVEPTAEPATLSTVSTLKARMASMGRDQGTGKPAEEEPDTEKKDEPVETGPLASQPAPVPPPPKIEPERPAVKKVEEKAHKPPASEKPAGHKPGIFSKVTATGKKEPPKPPVAQGPAPVKPGDEIQINWPPKSVEPPKPPSDVQINWPPKPVEPPKPSALEEAARQRVEAQQHAVTPEEAAPEEEAATEEPSEPVSPPSRSSFSEAARLRMEARQRASETRKPGAGPGESQPEGDADGGSGEGENRPPSP
jgi:hypothetical protein